MAQTGQDEDDRHCLPGDNDYSTKTFNGVMMWMLFKQNRKNSSYFGLHTFSDYFKLPAISPIVYDEIH